MPKKKNAVRADGRIAVQVYLGRDDSGKRKYKTVYGDTQKEADAKAEEVKLAMRKGLDVMAERDTFGDWAERWLKIKATEVGVSQAGGYKYRVDYINTYIKDASMNRIKTIDLQELISDLAESNPNTNHPASRRLLEITKSTLSQIFRLAIENRVLDYNPATAIKLPKSAPAQKRRALTDAEREWIHNTEHRARRAAMIMMYSGLRRGELIPLTWKDIDLNNQTISVNKTVEKIRGRFIIRNEVAKSDAGLRTVDIPKFLADYLRREKREGIFVCLNAQGTMHTESSWVRMWESYLLDINFKYGEFSPFDPRPKSKFDPKGTPFVIPRITPHWLRHTFATMLYFAGVDVLAAKEQLGHSDIKMTLEIYTHLDKEHKRKSMNKLDFYLNDASQMQVNRSNNP